ncbi:MAG: fumarylacetoacetate hydrolase family protein [Caldilineales bacterium]|nr:fumarylacetoacetate hydrolase family protein [Caldilineales bacterium]MDW8319041.1 fumarylacetoacetate hydrolase family protein [Anaerolineae bacterium]
MKIARAELLARGGEVRYGRIAEDRFYPFDGSPFEQPLASLSELPPLPLAEVRLLAPCRPTKVLAIGRNYAAHAAEHGAEVPKEPLLFLKPPSAVVGPGDPIVLTPLSQQVEHEAELVVVIGRRARHLRPEDALAAVLGYTGGNDVTARDLQRRDGQWSRAKGFDTFCPLGPWIETDLDPADQVVECLVNGQVRQRGHTRDLVFDVPHLLAYASAVMTLEPGDVLMTGTPAGVSPLAAGDVVVVRVSGIGELVNPVHGG